MKKPGVQKGTPGFLVWERSESAGTRTLDPLLKREMLYQLSYGFGANI
jgi:hypothetical protein